MKKSVEANIYMLHVICILRCTQYMNLILVTVTGA